MPNSEPGTYWQTERDGAVVVATYVNPPRNYLVHEAMLEFAQLIEQWRDPEIRAIVIRSDDAATGNMTHYSVEVLNNLVSDPKTARLAAALVREYKMYFDRLSALPKVVIAAMNGDTMGGGFEMTLACDIRIGEDGDFRYGHPEVKIGIIPGAGGTQRLARLIGLGKATEFILRSRVVTPQQALDLGIVSELAGSATDRAIEIAHEVAAFPPMAVANSKLAIFQGNDSTLAAGLEIESSMWIETMQSDDAKLAMETYLAEPHDKRRDWFEAGKYPEWSGH